jgi:hypothetical protein
MLGIVEGLISELLTFGPEFVFMLGAPELPRRQRFITVRQGRQSQLVKV